MSNYASTVDILKVAREYSFVREAGVLRAWGQGRSDGLVGRPFDIAYYWKPEWLFSSYNEGYTSAWVDWQSFLLDSMPKFRAEIDDIHALRFYWADLLMPIVQVPSTILCGTIY